MNRRGWARAAVAATLATCTAVLALAATPAGARTALAQLHVEGPGGTLDPGRWYVTGSERIRRSGASDSCPRRHGSIKVPGPTAMGLPKSGSAWNHDLRQVRVRRDEAGLFICEIGSVLGRPFTDPDGFAGWSYWKGYAFGSAAADQVRLHDGARILWVYSDFGSSPVNTGDALELRSVDAGTTDGDLTVRVVAHQFDGGRHPVVGATIRGADSVDDLGDGRYHVAVAKGFTRLQAIHGLDIPSIPVRTCFRGKPARCPTSHGRTIVGSGRGERLHGTRGWDAIYGRGGDDVVDISAGGRDRVSCGGGDDLVIRDDHDDRIAADCERVRSA